MCWTSTATPLRGRSTRAFRSLEEHLDLALRPQLAGAGGHQLLDLLLLEAGDDALLHLLEGDRARRLPLEELDDVVAETALDDGGEVVRLLEGEGGGLERRLRHGLAMGEQADVAAAGLGARIVRV